MNGSTLIPVHMAGDTLESLFAAHGPQRPVIYWMLLLGIIGPLIALPLIHVDVSVRASGWVRPTTERTELRPAVSGHILQVLARDNERVHAGQVLLTISTQDIDERISRNHAQRREKTDLIDDLILLIKRTGLNRTDAISSLRSIDLHTAALRQDLAQYLTQAESYRLAQNKAQNDFERYESLATKGIATMQELDNARFEAQRLANETRLLLAQTLAKWESRLRDEQLAVADLVSESLRLEEERAHYALRAPVDGVLVSFAGLSAGEFITASQSLGTVSPDDSLLIETFVSPRDVGMIRVGQPARLQIDAFSYTQWGTLDGIVDSISGDMLPSNANSPSGNSNGVNFKVVVRPQRTTLHLTNGLSGELRKGMTLSARYIVARRSLLQVLYEDVSGWLDPRATST